MLFWAIYFLLGALFCGAWYWFSRRYNRRKAVQILRWIEAALAGQGHVMGIRWISPSRFKVPLRLTSGVFNRAWVTVELIPCELPLKWLVSKLKKQQDVLIFQADLDLAPTFALHVNNFRWFARTTKKALPDNNRWNFEQTGPFIISSRMDWQKEIASTMTSLASNTNRDFLNISFQRRSPHFSVTLLLETISPTSPIRNYMFESMRELAASSSASLF
jgi:hypothetical protein